MEKGGGGGEGYWNFTESLESDMNPSIHRKIRCAMKEVDETNYSAVIIG